MSDGRTYLDHNASSPLRGEARGAETAPEAPKAPKLSVVSGRFDPPVAVEPETEPSPPGPNVLPGAKPTLASSIRMTHRPTAC